MKNVYFTAREQSVFCEMLSGLSNTEISEKYCISHYTAKAHVTSIIKKLNAKNRTNAVTKGLLKLMDIEPQTYEYISNYGIKNTFGKK